jgi:hypothetical protein
LVGHQREPIVEARTLQVALDDVADARSPNQVLVATLVPVIAEDAPRDAP